MEMDVRSGGRDGRNFEKFSVPDRLASLGVKAPGGGQDGRNFEKFRLPVGWRPSG